MAFLSVVCQFPLIICKMFANTIVWIVNRSRGLETTFSYLLNLLCFCLSVLRHFQSCCAFSEFMPTCSPCSHSCCYQERLPACPRCPSEGGIAHDSRCDQALGRGSECCSCSRLVAGWAGFGGSPEMLEGGWVRLEHLDPSNISLNLWILQSVFSCYNWKSGPVAE